LPDVNGAILLDMDIGTSVQAYNAGLSDIAGLSKTDSYFIVGNGTNWVTESGSTVRTSLGLGTGNSPQFTAVNIGNASDTTLARASAGNLTVEGKALYRVDGTDVAVADGGTGASTAADAATNLGLGAADTPTFAGIQMGDFEVFDDSGAFTIEDDGTPVFVISADGYIDVSVLTANAGLVTKNGSTSAGFVDLYEDSDNGENRVRLIGPASTADVTVTLPARTGTLAMEWPQVNKTATGNIDAAEAHSHITTDGAVSNMDLTLPSAVVGMKYRVVRSAAISLRLLPYTSQNFLGQNTSVAFSFDATGTCVTVECYATGVWTVTSQFGTYSWEPY
jgi:hypothetical protein